MKKRAPYPNELDRLEVVRRKTVKFGAPLLAANFVSVPLGSQLTQAGWSWADLAGNMELRAEGLVVSRRVSSAPKPQGKNQRRLPGGASSASLIRLMIGWPRDAPLPAVIDLAEKMQVSQPRISQILASLSDQGLVRKEARSWFVVDRGELLDRYIDERIGGAKETAYFYTLSPLDKLVERALDLDEGLLVSADVGADLIARWKEPASVVLYASRALAMDELGVVQADSPAAANVLLRSTSGAPVHPWPRLFGRWPSDGVEVPLVDPALMMRDMLDLGGSDRVEAAGVLRDWILGQNP